MAVANEEELEELEAQRTKLAEQQSAVLEQAPAPADAPDVPEAPVTPEAPETQPEPVDADADPETDEDTPMRSYLRLIQYSEMLQPKVIVVELQEPRIVGGIAVSVPTSSAEPEPPPPPSAAEPSTACGGVAAAVARVPLASTHVTSHVSPLY